MAEFSELFSFIHYGVDLEKKESGTCHMIVVWHFTINYVSTPASSENNVRNDQSTL